MGNTNLCFVDKFDPLFFCVMRSDGHLFQYNFLGHHFCDVSGSIDFLSKTLIENQEEFLDLMLEGFELFFSQREKIRMDEENFSLSFEIGAPFTYYTKDGQIVGQDKDKNEYLFTNYSLVRFSKSVITKEWKKISRRKVVYELLHLNDTLNILELKTYLDENGDIIANDDRRGHHQYRISHRTGDILEMLPKRKIDSKCTPYHISKEDTLSTEYKLDYRSLQNMRKVEKFINDNRRRFSKKGMKIGKDLFYVTDGFGNFYATDENQYEFKITYEMVIPVKKGTINKNWTRVDHCEILDLCFFYEKRRYLLKNNKTELSLYDLKLYRNEDGIYYGYTEDNQIWILYYDGELVPIEYYEEKEGTKFALQEYDAHIVSALSEQTRLREENILHCYLFLHEEELSKKYNVAVSSSISVYIKEDNNGFSRVFIKDNNGCEFRCYLEEIVPVTSGTIEKEGAQLVPYNLAYKTLINDCINRQKEFFCTNSFIAS